ncbi:hypothetical protein JXA63_03690 [Candidatus Woesebacteria bacterium]|nr:hypothetical protein [Candidatus Woesebacteria bacterium]
MDLIETVVADLWIAGKTAILIFLGIYVIFSAVVVKQAKLMTETLDVELDEFIVAVSYIHMLASLGVLISSVVLL